MLHEYTCCSNEAQATKSWYKVAQAKKKGFQKMLSYADPLHEVVANWLSQYGYGCTAYTFPPAE